jgi:hypothetical protein
MGDAINTPSTAVAVTGRASDLCWRDAVQGRFFEPLR